MLGFMSTVLSTPSEVIDALGGTLATAQIFHCPMQRVSNWRRSGIPSKYSLATSEVLAALGKRAAENKILVRSAIHGGELQVVEGPRAGLLFRALGTAPRSLMRVE